MQQTTKTLRGVAAGALLLLALATGPAQAKFEIKGQAIEVTGERNIPRIGPHFERVLAEDITKWWIDHESFHGRMERMSLDFKPGGCLCETTPEGNEIVHFRVVSIEHANPDGRIILKGVNRPGPHQGTTQLWEIAWDDIGASTNVTWRYRMVGPFEGDPAVVAKRVDANLTSTMIVLGHELLKRFGRPRVKVTFKKEKGPDGKTIETVTREVVRPDAPRQKPAVVDPPPEPHYVVD